MLSQPADIHPLVRLEKPGDVWILAQSQDPFKSLLLLTLLCVIVKSFGHWPVVVGVGQEAFEHEATRLVIHTCTD